LISAPFLYRPTTSTPVCAEMADYILVYVRMTSNDTEKLIKMMYNIKDAGVIEDVKHAVV